jgi:hypothetical protein
VAPVKSDCVSDPARDGVRASPSPDENAEAGVGGTANPLETRLRLISDKNNVSCLDIWLRYGL